MFTCFFLCLVDLPLQHYWGPSLFYRWRLKMDLFDVWHTKVYGDCGRESSVIRELRDVRFRRGWMENDFRHCHFNSLMWANKFEGQDFFYAKTHF